MVEQGGPNPAGATASPSPGRADVLAAQPGWRRVFVDPSEVVAADLDPEEKRAILASWASDLWAVESAPALRHCPGLPGRTVPLDRILDALRGLDEEGHPAPSAAKRPDSRVRWLAPARRVRVH